jgi:hypothetical protein
MLGANKILTVSYGTFSCTLEGFDEPFNTMKAIAEYFRDLAAEDRYFGAEPPQPDAAMLHRIAEREIQRRVEARVQDNGVILRAGEDDAPPAAAAALPAAEAPVARQEAPVEAAPVVALAAPGPVAEAAPEPVAAFVPDEDMEPAPPVEAEPEPELPVLAPAMPEGVAAKLARLRRAVQQAATPAVVLSVAELSFEDEGALAAPLDSGAGFAAMDFGMADAELVEEPVAEAVMPVVPDAAEDAAPVAGPAEAPVAETQAFADLAEDFAAEAAAEEILPGYLADASPVPTTVADDDVLARLTRAEALAEDAEAPAEDATPADDDLGNLIATLSGGADEAEATQVEADPFALDAEFAGDEAIYDLGAEPDLPQPALAELGDLNDDLPEALLQELGDDLPEDLADELPEDLGAATADDLPEDSAADLPEDLAEEMAAEAAVADEIADDAPEVVAVPHADEPAGAETAAMAGAAEETAPEADAPEAGAAAAAVELADKAQRARARVIKIRRADATPPAPVEPAAEAVEDVAAEPASPALPGPGADEDVARLLKQADDEMSVPENQRRLAAIKHLKAAVAATVADRRAGVAQPSDEERADPYRADLARVVRPVRPRGSDGNGAPRLVLRPSTDGAPVAPGTAANDGRPAPLVLVMEQRIDRPAPTPVMPVRPRRIAGGAGMAAAGLALQQSDEEMHAPVHAEAALDDFETSLQSALAEDAAADWDDDAADEGDVARTGGSDNIFADSRDFGEFAERLGATGLPDLLEAAAAYATCVEKREHFTRPLLMRRVTDGQSGEKISREEGLRSFGTLLREGKIEKVRRGHYALSERSALLAEARRIAG